MMRFLYYLNLAAYSFRSTPIYSGLMVLSVALGIGATMSIVTVYTAMGSNPMQAKGRELFAVQVDNWDPNLPFFTANGIPTQMSFLDAMGLQKQGAARGFTQTATTSHRFIVRPDSSSDRVLRVDSRSVSSNFFGMFNVPFRYGSGWDSRAEDSASFVVVLSNDLNEQLFGGANSVGKTILLNNEIFQVVGVLDSWRPLPKFYDLSGNPFNAPEELYVPVSLVGELLLRPNGAIWCWKPPDGDDFEAFLQSECSWLQFWAHLRSAEDLSSYQSFLENYVEEQKRLGRIPGDNVPVLSNVEDWLAMNAVVQTEARLMLVVALLFLAICLLNTVALLVARFVRKRSEVALRRALGAPKIAIFCQFILESGIVGVSGGILGILVTKASLAGIEALFGAQLDSGLLLLDWFLVVGTVCFATLCALLAGIYPTWKVCSIDPSRQLHVG